MDHGVRRPANRSVCAYRIFESLTSQDSPDPQVFVYHFDNSAPCQLGEGVASSVDGGDCGVAGKTHTKRFDQTCHSRSRAHGHAMTLRAMHATLGFEELPDRHCAGSNLFRHLPETGTGSRVSIMDNGAKKGGTPSVWDAIEKSPGLEDLWQLHYSDEGGAAHNVAAGFIANPDGPDARNYLELTVASKYSTPGPRRQNAILLGEDSGSSHADSFPKALTGKRLPTTL